MNQPAHKYFVNKFIDWELIEDRLSRYSNIEQNFNIGFLKECAERPPFYCHYMAWRLGTWEDDNLFAFFDDLIGIASSLPNWDKELPLLRSAEFGSFWGLTWQMQVAKYFCDKDAVDVEWFKDEHGPDLEIKNKENVFFVECYNFSKSFMIEQFIIEIFSRIDSNIKVGHQMFLRFSLPQSGKAVEKFLNELFSPYLDDKYFEEKLAEAEVSYPVLLPVPKGIENFFVYLEGSNSDNYQPGVLPGGGGDSEKYVEVMVNETLKNKQKSNRLKELHPNMLAINYLIGGDLQTAYRHCISQDSYSIPKEYFTTFDAVIFESCGIESVPEMNTTFISDKYKGNHPLLSIG